MKIIVALISRIAKSAALSKETVAKFILKTIAAIIVSAIVVTIGTTIATTVSAIVDPQKRYNLTESGLGYEKGEKIEGNDTDRYMRGYTVTHIDDIDKEQQPWPFSIERLELIHTPGAGLCQVSVFVEVVDVTDYDDLLNEFAAKYEDPSHVSASLAVWQGKSLKSTQNDLYFMYLRYKEESKEVKIHYTFDNYRGCGKEIECMKEEAANDGHLEACFDAAQLTSSNYLKSLRLGRMNQNELSPPAVGLSIVGEGSLLSHYTLAATARIDAVHAPQQTLAARRGRRRTRLRAAMNHATFATNESARGTLA